MKKTTCILLGMLTQICSGNDMTESYKIKSAKIQSGTEVEVTFEGHAPAAALSDVSIDGGASILDVGVDGGLLKLKTAPLDVRRNYHIQVMGARRRELIPDGILDEFFSDKPLGCTLESGNRFFRVFAPRAVQVRVELFDAADDPFGSLHEMKRDCDGVWELSLEGALPGKWYGYRITGPDGENEMARPDLTIADPYSPAMATRNHFLHAGRTLIPGPTAFDWQGDTWCRHASEDLVIYEMHVRDMTAHPSAGLDSRKAGSYLGLIESGKRGGIDYLSALGVNAVELLPVQEFGNIELDYKNPALKLYNDWNPYCRNHWGYMTTGFFAPESYYASDGSVEPGGWSGTSGAGIDELKRMVRSLHSRGMAVIMDVVYNHVSNYDLNPFKYIDTKYYFRLDENGQFLSGSGCGNDFKTERPMARRMIVESLLHWMREFHIDGFRFDLASMIDAKTLDMITQETRKVNPDVILIAEPWGGGKYGQEEFSARGWAAWNDMFRNGVKGQNPRDGQGFIFGKWQGGNTPESLRQYVTGTLKSGGGPFYLSSHSVNYLESHDDETLGDFIRLATGDVKDNQVIDDAAAGAALTPRQLSLHRLAALFLFTSRGPVMIHAGQEFGRSKVIAATDAPDARIGRIDRNSYNKDNETNWIDYRHSEMNRGLVDYYRGLIALRKTFSAFRGGGPESVNFLETPSPLVVAYTIRSEKEGGQEFIVALNGDPREAFSISIPAGKWAVLADETRAGKQKLRSGISDTVTIPKTAGMVLVRD